MEKEEMKRLANTPLMTYKDLRTILKPLGVSSYKSAIIFDSMKKTYTDYAKVHHYVTFPHSVPNEIAFDFLKQFGVTREKLLEESYWN